MKIGALAKRSGLSAHTIRYYERVGLLPSPERTASGYRAYTPSDIDRLRFIARGRDLGFSLEEIRSLLQLSDGDERLSCSDVDRVARAHLADVHARVADLRRMASELERVIDQCEGGHRGKCTILSALRKPAA